MYTHNVKQMEDREGNEFPLTCCHGIPVEIIEILGVVSYRHKDKQAKPCMLMNRLDCSPAAIGKAFYNDRIKNTPAFVAIIATCDDVRKHVYLRLSKLPRATLAVELKEYLDAVDQAIVMDKQLLIREFVTAFGKVGIENAKCVAGISYENMAKNNSGPPKYGMQKLTPKDVEDIDGTAENRLKRSRVNIEDILYRSGEE